MLYIGIGLIICNTQVLLDFITKIAYNSLSFKQVHTMSMHLHHPSLSLTGKKKGKAKFRNAAEAQRARDLEASWKELLKSQGVEAEAKRRKRAMEAEPLQYNLNSSNDRAGNKHIPSLNTGHTGAVRTKGIPKYTGTKILGIGTMHKSNAVPVFSEEEAHSIATMRRG
jgi:hypothetical protein